MSKGPRNVVVVQGMFGASEGVREDVGVRDSLVSLKKSMNTLIIMRLTKEKHIAPLVDIRFTHFIYKTDQEEL